MLNQHINWYKISQQYDEYGEDATPDYDRWEEKEVAQDLALERAMERGEEENPQWLQDMIGEFSGGTSDFDSFDLIEEPDGTWWLWGYGEYGPGSVLEGQYLQARLESYDTLEEARAEYPDVPIKGELNLPSSMVTQVPDVPPAGFDPADIGERWDEEY